MPDAYRGVGLISQCHARSHTSPYFSHPRCVEPSLALPQDLLPHIKVSHDLDYIES